MSIGPPVMSPEPGGVPGQPLMRPRPGHADLPGGMKYAQRDLRNILERASARETTVRVAAGAVAKKFLSEFGIKSKAMWSGWDPYRRPTPKNGLPPEPSRGPFPVRMLDAVSTRKAMRAIDRAPGKETHSAGFSRWS